MNHQSEGKGPTWLCLFGQLDGFLETGRAQEKMVFSIPDFQLQGTVLTAHVHDPPLMNEAGRLSRSWLQGFLCADHSETAAKGISILVSRLSQEHLPALSDWHGRLTNGATFPAAGDPSALRDLLQREVLPHADAYLDRSKRHPEADEFMTPPKPQPEESAEEYPGFPRFPNSEPSTAVQEAKQALSQYDPTELDEETAHTVAAAFDVEPHLLQDEIPIKPISDEPSTIKRGSEPRSFPSTAIPDAGHPGLPRD